MRTKLISLLKSDLKSIFRDTLLLIAILALFMMILLLRYAYPLFSDYFFSDNGLHLSNYYSLIAITLVSVIPMLIGIIYAFLLTGNSSDHCENNAPLTITDKREFFILRMIVPAALSFLILLVIIFITDPVPTQGWLRTIFVSILLSTQAPFAFLFVGSLAGNRFGTKTLSKVYAIFIAAVPFGFLIHHPWTCFAFFSPQYWISWAWITVGRSECIIYATIASAITTGGAILFYMNVLKKYFS